MTVEELRAALANRDGGDDVSAYLDGVQGDGATQPRPVLGFAIIDGRILLVVGRRDG